MFQLKGEKAWEVERMQVRGWGMEETRKKNLV